MGPKKSMQQSRSAYDIYYKNDIKNSDMDGHTDSSRNNTKQLQEFQSGNSWSCMWLNHMSRQEQESHKRMKKFMKNNRMIINNPHKFGAGINVNGKADQAKQHYETSLLKNSCGNDFVKSMTGCPIQKVHKMRDKKREKLKKYIVDSSTLQQSYQNKNAMQNGKISINSVLCYF